MSYRSRQRRALPLRRAQRQARGDAKLAAGLLVLSLAIGALAALASFALYPIALGETGVSAARVADASALLALLAPLAFGGALGVPFFAAMLLDATRRF